MSDQIRELDHRTNDGLAVTLLWDPQSNAVFISMVEAHGVSSEFEVAGAEALDAFRHPYFYAERDQLLRTRAA